MAEKDVADQSTTLLPAAVDSEILPTETIDKKWTIPYLRYFVLFIGVSTEAIAISCGYAYNFAVVCNVDQSTNAKAIYERSPSNSTVMYYSGGMTNLIYSSLPAGNIIGLFGLIPLMSTVSMRKQVAIGTAISTLVTALIPVAFDYWTPSTLILKLIQGAAMAPTITVIGHIAGNWTPLAEVGFFIAILSSHSQIGLLLTMATAGPLCEYFGWRSIFYFNAACSSFVLLLWCIFFSDTPAQHKRISSKEFQLIKPNEKQVVQKRAKVPYSAFFATASVWAVLIAALGNYNGISPIIIFSSAILKKAVGVTDVQASMFNGVSFAMQLVLKIVSGVLSDKWTSVSESFKARLFNTVSCGLSGILMIVTAFLPVENKMLCASFIALTQGVIGLNAAGFNRAAMIVTKQHAHFIVTLIGVIIAASTIAEPFLVWAVAPDTTWNQWFFLLVLHGAILVVSNVIFCVMIRAKPAKFTESNPIQNLIEEAKNES